MFKIIQKDFLPSIVVFLVAIPLCIGIALACGVSPVAGLLSGIIGGLVVGSFNGCPLMVSGPAAGLIAIVWDIINHYGLEGLALSILCAGLIQIMIGTAKLGVMFRAVSPAVIQGMLAGIGALIFFSQFHVMLDAVPSSSGFQNLVTIPQSVFDGLFSHVGSKSQMAALIGSVTIITIYLWSFVPQKLKTIPAVLVGVILGSITAQLLGAEINFVQTPKSLLIFPNIYSSQFWSQADYMGILGSAIGLAFIATAQALLTATATDKLHTGKKTDYNREVLAQGVGNVFCGLLGALPVTGVIVRSAANAQSGGITRASAIMHAIWILTFILIFPMVLQLIPVCTLAAALVYTGWRLMNPKNAQDLSKHSKIEVLIYLSTAVSIFSLGLLNGVLIGFILAVIQVVYKLNHCVVDVQVQEQRVTVSLEGNATFLALPKLAPVLDHVEKEKDVSILIQNLNYIDHAILDLFKSWESDYENNPGNIHIDWDEIHTLISKSRSNSNQSHHEFVPS